MTTALGDPLTVQQLDEATIRRLVQVCARLGGAATAEDLAQETLVAALRSSRRPARPEAMDAWLVGVARNIVRRHWRGQRTMAPLAQLTEDPAADTVRDEDVVARREQLVHRAVTRLPRAERSLVIARHLAGRPTGEIAAELGLSAAAASMRLSRATAALRRVITEELGEDARAVGIRVDGGWRPTPLWCTDCGDGRIELRRTAERVAFRCVACASRSGRVGSEFRLANRTFGRILGGVAQPAALARRAAAWSHDYFGRPAGSGQVPCTSCGRLSRLAPYRRAGEDLPLRHRIGLYARCDACGESVSSSLGGLVAARPEARDLRARAGRVRAVEAVATEVDGRAALVAGVRAVRGAAAMEMVVAADTLRVLSVRTVG